MPDRSPERLFRFTRRMVHYCREVISCISSEQNKAFLAEFDKRHVHPDEILVESIENVEMILQLLSKLLQKERVNGIHIKQLMNQNAAGQLIIDIVSLYGKEGGSRERGGSLLDRALRCGIELLRGGYNVSCQRIILRYLSTPPHAELFFGSVQSFLDLPTSHQRGAREEGGPGADAEEGAAEGAWQLQSLTTLLHFLQLLCEGHYRDMQNLIFKQPSFLPHCLTLFQRLVSLNVSPGLGHFQSSHALLLVRLLDFLIEAVQGPCLPTQQSLLGSEPFIASLSLLAAAQLPPARVHWNEVPVQCRHFEVLLSSRDPHMALQSGGGKQGSQLINFAELKGIKNRVLLLQVSLLEGRELVAGDTAGFMTKTLKER